MFAALFTGVTAIVLAAVGPLWDQVVEFAGELPAYWEDLTSSAAFQEIVSSGTQDSVRSTLGEVAGGLPGVTIAAVIFVAVALTVSTPAAIAILAIQLVYQQVENYIVYPLVYRQAVELSAFTTIVAVLVAASLLGVVGAILAVPFAAVVKVVLREASAPRRARMDALREA